MVSIISDHSDGLLQQLGFCPIIQQKYETNISYSTVNTPTGSTVGTAPYITVTVTPFLQRCSLANAMQCSVSSHSPSVRLLIAAALSHASAELHLCPSVVALKSGQSAMWDGHVPRDIFPRTFPLTVNMIRKKTQIPATRQHKWNGIQQFKQTGGVEL